MLSSVLRITYVVSGSVRSPNQTVGSRVHALNYFTIQMDSHLISVLPKLKDIESDELMDVSILQTGIFYTNVKWHYN